MFKGVHRLFRVHEASAAADMQVRKRKEEVLVTLRPET